MIARTLHRLNRLHPLQRLASGRASPLAAFWRWWSAELRAALPQRLRRYLRSARREVLVAVDANRAVISLQEAEGETGIGSFPVGSAGQDELAGLREQLAVRAPLATECRVELPREKVLVRSVELPLETEQRLADVLNFEMDRLTPFSAGQVYHDFRVLDRDTGRRRIRVEVTVALRRFVDGLIDKLGACGLETAGVTVAGMRATPELLPPGLRRRPGQRGRWLGTGLTVVAAVLLATVLALPLVQQRLTLDRLRAEIDTLRPQALAAADARDEIRSLEDQRNFFADRRRAVPTVISVLDEVTRIVPDDTWLTRFELTDRQLRLHGESESASALIALLDASPMLTDVRFASPVTKNPRTSNDRFVAEMTLAEPGVGTGVGEESGTSREGGSP